MNDIKKAGVVLFGELYAATGLPGAVTISKALDRAEQKQKYLGIKILIEELQKGHEEGISFQENDADEFVQILLRFNRAVEDGSARRNLRLLAQMIVGSKRFGALEPDRFRQFSSRLQDLSRDELIVLAHAYKVAEIAHRSKDAEAQEGSFTTQLIESLAPVMDARRSFVVAASLIRTGFLEPMPGLDGMSYQATPDLLLLGKLANWKWLRQHEAYAAGRLSTARPRPLIMLPPDPAHTAIAARLAQRAWTQISSQLTRLRSDCLCAHSPMLSTSKGALA